ncbi:hypothetical protein CSQ85_00180 [Bifidobacterium rousetti]|uniref:Ig-like domain-containing protein n=1 Tax=Bifidobacterium rousetti TaxID=2045439 RepID=UPI00123C2D1E|nr:Ig-like domain-containing protein [Bifidobacterium rousetti]KAA8820269.1 hypothetical protein CSQ85_00180 [Bifidobacterium rousetti]
MTVSPNPVTLRVGETVALDIRVLPEGAPQDVTVVFDHPDIVSVKSVEGGYSLTAVKDGTATLTVASTADSAVTALIPVTVVSNMLRYGPATGFNGDKATVNEDGTLNLTGTAATGWTGLKWEQDIAAFPPGTTFTLGCYDLPDELEIMLQFNGNTAATHMFTSPARNSFKPTGVVPADAKTVFMAIRRHNTASDFTVTNVKPMCNTGSTLLPFEAPADISFNGGA